MNKSLYHFGIFFLGLTVACGLAQGIFQLLFGASLFTQNSFIAWFLMMHIVATTGVIIVLKYYHYQKYWAAFYTGIMATIASLGYNVIFLTMLLSRSSSNYYVPAILISLCITIIYALILIFSGTGKKTWLRIGGAYILVLGLILAPSIGWSLLSKDVQLNSILAKVAQWASMAGGLVPIPFMIHFLGEIKLLNTENTSPVKESFKVTLGIVRAFALIVVLILGVMLTSEGNSSKYWENVNFESTQRMAQLFESRTFVNSKGDTLFYHLLKPLNFDPAKKYPLVVSLPYGGQPATDKVRQMEGAVAAEVLSTNINRTNYPAFLFIPNCPPGSGWGGIPNYPSVDSLVYEAISSLDKEPGIDVKRRYVTGLSRGGYGAWHFICTRPDMFAAAIPVSGGEDPKLASRIVNIPVWAFHGAKDKNVPVSGSRGMIEAMRKAGGNPKYTEFPNEGHNIWYQVSITPGLWDWLFAQKRNQ
ncbi:Dienelactone hydrolase family protein [Mucilaginibacter pineti]|uniref:Dienelactone hydrolase family protein n=1 Tax=Mucilaginibacter pineti TaxID=1391627 RepID=A0A1G7FFA5_9SPHI|nr:dienelactone hydrolase family protein [Mucilaginibacter pineti]SDE74537.1 Dienelactone hydrolase family protein [Mucilaginibacter pineti]